MVLFTGGAFQGKRTAMQSIFGIADHEIMDGKESADDKSAAERDSRAKAVAAFDHYHLCIRRQMEQGLDPLEELEKLYRERPDIILLCDEVGQGIVPLEQKERDYREAVGRTMCAAAAKADAVYRVICGIAERIK
ncbi:MAG: bifunctional adenosylcobinamide kinase/adenosylcobinamide-phosphate guanylyltransferase [Lachnospiraceae bacterium]|nr:bifunctional adenosylcobinamide kinase/adenosylcobinamide-phosphate guanylyltransferase [Lachnospiraceae bacterium]